MRCLLFGCRVGLDRRCSSGACCQLRRQAPGNANFIGPHRHGRQGRIAIFGCQFGDGQGIQESLPHQEQLLFRALQDAGKALLHANPSGIAAQCQCLLAPLGDIRLQGVQGGFSVFPRLGGEHLNALGQKHCYLALHLHFVLQIFNAFGTFEQLDF